MFARRFSSLVDTQDRRFSLVVSPNALSYPVAASPFPISPREPPYSPVFVISPEPDPRHHRVREVLRDRPSRRINIRRKIRVALRAQQIRIKQ